MALKVLHAGDGYQYLMRQVVTGDAPRQGRDPLTAYYHAEGNPPGEWIGSGTTALGVSGHVREDQMQALYGERLHPEANRLIAAAIAEGKSFTEALTGVRLGRKLAQYDNDIPLLDELRAAYDRFEQQHHRRPGIQERRRIKEHTAAALLTLKDPDRTWSDTEIRTYITNELGKARQPVSGFDLVFSQPTKTGDILWALGDHRVRTALEHAHHEAVHTAIAYLEQEAAFSRTGKAGIAHVDTTGLIATAFTHRESRAGDPNLHTHVAVANTALGTDGRWRTLDSRQLHTVAVSASEVYNAAWERGVSRRLDVHWELARRGPGKRPVREIAGLPDEWIVGFAQRRTQVENIYDTLIARYVRQYGVTPPRTVQLKLAQQAAVTDRPSKDGLKSLGQQLADWADRAQRMRPDLDIAAVVHAATHAAPTRLSAADLDLAAVSARVIDQVSEHRATWTVYHVRSEVERQLRGVRTVSEQQHQILADTITRHALRHDSVRLDQEAEPHPVMLQRATGEPVFRCRGFTRYTSQDILDAEHRLVHATRIRHGPVVTEQTLDNVLRRLRRTIPKKKRTILNPGQRDLVRSFVSSGRALAVAIGPPGAGKSTAMKAVAAAWKTTGGRVIGLAPSAAAASVLGDVLGIGADTLHSLVHAYDTHHAIDVRRGDMLLVDEAGMAGTRMLDRIRALAAERGAVVRLVGDYRQLAAVEAGGALRLIHTEAGGTELTELHRFTDPDEARAILQVRVGDLRATRWYATHHRLHGGPQAAVLDQLYRAWRTDRENGHTSIMSADRADIAAELSARAQTELRTTGQVEHTGVLLRDGNHAGRGDTIVTRLNKRTMRPRLNEHVKNGDLWTVLHRNPDGSLTARHLKHRGKITLPATYVTHFVELGYAATIHRTQGMTVDIGRAALSPHATRELATVAVSRGTHENHLYLDTTETLNLDEPHTLPGDLFHKHRNTQAAANALAAILRHEGTEKTATEELRDAFELPHRLDHQIPEYEHALRLHRGEEYGEHAEQWVRDAAPHLADTILTDDAWPALLDALQETHDLGHDPVTILTNSINERELDTAHSITKVLHHRITQHLDTLDPLPHDQIGADLDGRRPDGFPHWIPSPPPPGEQEPDAAHAELHDWLHHKAHSIANRIHLLAQRAAHTQPPWTTHLGPPPDNPTEHETWLHKLGQIAAYRERWQIPDTETTPLGPQGRGTQRRTHHWLQNHLGLKKPTEVNPTSATATETQPRTPRNGQADLRKNPSLSRQGIEPNLNSVNQLDNNTQPATAVRARLVDLLSRAAGLNRQRQDASLPEHRPHDYQRVARRNDDPNQGPRMRH
ncbi:MobF family relaxase [Actinosynnema sp. CS-041913]|uniref:MobF family relaxase n=1 Tax=Actinosynnema sp. CS-041913 TaxID=3239917 RepID=UPI003D8BD204